MDATAEREQWTEDLLCELEESNFPTVALLDRIERMISTRDELDRYTAILNEKVRGEKFPTAHMQDRLLRLLELLQRLEQAQE
jgi:hypothetical protein